MTPRERFVLAALAYLNATSLWAARSKAAVDCSGLVSMAMHDAAGPDHRATHNTDRMFAEYEALRPEDASVGDLVFWYSQLPDAKERGDVEHVGILLWGGAVLTADGATPRIREYRDAKQAGHVVRVRQSVDYRPRFAGYRRAPLPLPAVKEVSA